MKKSTINKIMVQNLIKSQIEGLVFQDKIPNRDSLNEDNLKKICEKFDKKILSPKIIGEIISDISFKEILDKTKYDDNTEGSKKIGEFTKIDITDLVKKIYDFIADLPKKYIFIFRLPKCSIDFSEIDLAYGIELLKLTDEKIGEYVTEETLRRSLVDLISKVRGEPTLSVGDVILKVSCKGYVGKYGTIKINIIDPLYTFKTVLGIYIALSIIHRRQKHESLAFSSEYSYAIYDKTNMLVRVINESTEDAQYLANMEFDATKFNFTEIEKIMKKKTTLFEDANQIIKNSLAVVRFAKGKTDKKVIRRQRMIKNGSYWFYEALKTIQEHIRAIYTTTAFDSLLELEGADDKKEFKAEIVSSSIAKNILESDVIRKGIIDLYKLRNEIVHGERQISSLEQYGEFSESPSRSTIMMGVWYLTRFLAHRIYFINGGLSAVIKATSGRS